jgi:hypothetical protein
MSDTILLQFAKDDAELRHAIAQAFGSEAELIEVKNFDAGIMDVVQAVVPLVSPLIPIVSELLINYFTRKDATKSGRVILTKDGDISVEGLSREEVEALVKKLREA